MNVVGTDGDYEYVAGTRTLLSSDHPIHCARIEIALPKGEWLYAAQRGHQLKKYQTKDQTKTNMDAFEKELLLYLSKYSPEVQSALGERGAVSLDLTISEDALNV